MKGHLAASLWIIAGLTAGIALVGLGIFFQVSHHTTLISPNIMIGTGVVSLFISSLLIYLNRQDTNIHPKQLINPKPNDLPKWAREEWEKGKDTKPLIIDSETTQEQLEAHLQKLGIDPSRFKIEKR